VGAHDGGVEQRGTLTIQGVTHQVIEIIGAEKPFGANAPAELTSRADTDTGDTLGYPYELADDVFTVWVELRGRTGEYAETGSRSEPAAGADGHGGRVVALGMLVCGLAPGPAY
jgi:hypothetical protein